MVLAGLISTGCNAKELESLKTQLQTVRGENEELNKQLGEKDVEVKKIPDLNTKITALQGEFDKAKADLAALTAEKEALAKENADAKKQVEDRNEWVKQLQAKSNMQERRIAELEEALAKATTVQPPPDGTMPPPAPPKTATPEAVKEWMKRQQERMRQGFPMEEPPPEIKEWMDKNRPPTPPTPPPEPPPEQPPEEGK